MPANSGAFQNFHSCVDAVESGKVEASVETQASSSEQTEPPEKKQKNHG